ncbi:MAG TPA: O-antigen ligase family protein [Candidatus Krumholzibacteria bacterium]|nr:O-antigen ligase family protein [Candidatus Krumholzibacteria bacterium]
MKPISIRHFTSGRPPRWLDRTLDIAMRIIPPAALVAIGALFAAQQAVAPNQRAIKALVMMGLMALMFRFDMVYSVYLFALLFPFPSGISIGSSNTVLMTIIPMIWAIRATSAKIAISRKSPLDAAIAVFLLAHVIALINISDVPTLVRNIEVIWRQAAACTFFYMIFLFVNTEEKLFRLVKIASFACFLVMSTAVLELFFPGTTIIPGWIGLANKLGEGTLSRRVQGLRVGGSFESHGMLADFGTQLILFMAFFFLRARNPAEKAFWLAAVGTTVVAILATANRGATAGLLVGLLFALVYFRRAIGPARLVLLVGGLLVGLGVLDTFMSQHTIAVSVLDRFTHTEFEGVVPDTRTMTWKPALLDGLKSPLFGSGPFYDTGVGLTKRYWPHNGYIFFFCTLGLFGLGAFLWVMGKVYQESRLWRHPALRGTPLRTLMTLSQIWLFVLAFEQLRTDHQRDAIYPHIVWMCFGVVTAGAAIARRRIAEQSVADAQGAVAGNRPVTSMKS